MKTQTKCVKKILIIYNGLPYYLIVRVFCVSSLSRRNRKEVVADQTAGRAVEVKIVRLRNWPKRGLKKFFLRLKKSLGQRQFLWKGGSPLRKDGRREPPNQKLVNQPTCRMSANFFLMTLWLVKIWQHGLASCRVVKETKTPFSFRGISSLSLS